MSTYRGHLWPIKRTGQRRKLQLAAIRDFLERHRHNFIRLWTWDSVTWDTRANRSLGKAFVHRVAPLPWSRVGSDKALDGKPKFDLRQFDPVYFERLRTRVSEAGRRGIYVSVMLFEGWGLMHGNRGRAAPAGWAWRGHPFHRDNNINGIDAGVRGDTTSGGYWEFQPRCIEGYSRRALCPQSVWWRSRQYHRFLGYALLGRTPN